MLKHLDLFSGIGGFALAARMVGGYETVGFCEIEPYCQAVLRKHWPDVPVYDDVRTLSGRDTGAVDVISGGYPCQPLSLAGKRAGAADDRHLWPEFARLVSELRPAWVLAENVPGHVSMGLDSVLSDLEGIGYSCRSFVIPACAVDAKHRRERLYIVAHAVRPRRRIQPFPEPERKDAADAHDDGPTQSMADATVGAIGAGLRKPDEAQQRDKPRNGCCYVADTAARGSQGRQLARGMRSATSSERASELTGGCADGNPWPAEPDVGRVAHGIPRRVDRLRGLGNAIVPQVAAIFLQAIKECAAGQATPSR